MSKADMRYFEKAKAAASMSDYKRVNIGCVAVLGNHVIGIGYNTEKTHPIQKYYNRYRIPDGELKNQKDKLHAEISCLNSIRHMDIDMSKVRLYIYRARKDRPYSLSRPCPSCMAAIKDLGIKHVYYTTNDGFVYELIERLSVA